MDKISRALEMLCLMQIANIVLVGRHFSCSNRECLSRTTKNKHNREGTTMVHFQRISCSVGVIWSTVTTLTQYLLGNPAGNTLTEPLPTKFRPFVEGCSPFFVLIGGEIFPRSLAEWDCFISCLVRLNFPVANAFIFR